LTFVNGYKLSNDTVIDGNLYIVGAIFDLNGKNLTVNGNVILSSDSLNISKGQLTVKGDLRLQRENVASDGTVTYDYGNGYLNMVNDADSVFVDGNFVVQSQINSNGYLSAGTLAVKGNFTQISSCCYTYNSNFYATGTHKVILNGTGLQTVNFQGTESKFNILEINNNSNDGVKFTSSLNATKYIGNGCKVSFPNGETTGWQLTKDETYDGDLYLGAGTLDLNGYKLTVNGNLIQSAGTVFVNGGQLDITGDYRIQSAVKAANGTVTYKESSGTLKMTNEADYVKVGGSFITQSLISHDNLLTAGTLEVKGDFTQSAF